MTMSAATALIVIDMQNAFLHPNGENYYPCAPAVIVPVQQLIAQAEAQGKVIVHVADIHRAGFADFEQNRLPVHSIVGGFHAEYFDGFGPKGRPHEIEIIKRRYSAFFGTDLALFLAEQGIKRILICGVKTNVCVRATAQDAFAHGLEVCVAHEAVNTNRDHLGAAALEDIGRYLGRTVDMKQALEILT